MVPKKGKSNRQTLAQKYKQQKRAKEHHRKLDKDAKRAKKKGISITKHKTKDPGIPNEWPHKEELLKQIERAKLALEERKAAQKEARKDSRKAAIAARRGLGVGGATSLLGLVDATAERGAAFMAAAGVAEQMATKAEGTAKASQGEGARSRRAFLKELRKVVEQADVVLEVRPHNASRRCNSHAQAAVAAARASPLLLLSLSLPPTCRLGSLHGHPHTPAVTTPSPPAPPRRGRRCLTRAIPWAPAPPPSRPPSPPTPRRRSSSSLTRCDATPQ